MKRVKWNDKLSVKLPEIDAEHRALYQITGCIQDAMHSGATLAQIAGILQDLVAHSRDHFVHEESLMKSSRYSGTAWHTRQHEAATGRLLEFEARIKGGDADAPAELVAYLVGFLRDHIAFADRMMGAHIRHWLRLRTTLAS